MPMSNDDAVRQRPDSGQLELAITFFYYSDLPKAIRFYEEVMGFTLAIDQGWSKICRMEGQAHVGLVDESRGMHRARREAGAALHSRAGCRCLARLSFGAGH
jgi:catechol 2,3-dioxygenase-like lactoylglutathione lyase family enzyme